MTVAPFARRLLSAAVPEAGLRQGRGVGRGFGRPCGARVDRRGVAGAAGAAGAARTQKRPAEPRPPRRPTPFPTVAACPSPTCACEPMPAMPEDLEIDRTSSLNGLVLRYDEVVMVCTGQPDWPSRIEEMSSGDNLAADLKELFGRGGKYSDPYHSIGVFNTSFPSSVPPRADLQTTSAYLLPSFRYVPFLPRVSFDSVDALARGFLLPERLHAAHDGRLSPAHRDLLTRKPAFQRLLYGVRDPIDDVLVVICGHGGRDARCGIMGPVLQAAFETQLARVGVDVRRGPVEIDVAAAEAADEAADKAARLLLRDPDAALASPPPPSPSPQAQSRSLSTAATHPPMSARVGLISHIGGHQFAGNVIINLPPGLRLPDQRTPHPLAGLNVWYGRVEPQHVEGLVRETFLKGTVVEEHFRGATNQKREIIQL